MSDTGYSDYARLNADGTSDAVFPGGVELPVQTDVVRSPANFIRWIQSVSGQIMGTIQSRSITGDPGDAYWQLALRSQYAEDSPARTAGLDINAGAGTSWFSTPKVVAIAGGAARVLLDAAGGSGFMLSAAPFPYAPRAVDIGTGAIEFDGADAVSEVTVAHNLERVPAAATMSGLGGADLFYSVAPLGAIAMDDTTITFAAQEFDLDELVLGTYLFTWIAVG